MENENLVEIKQLCSHYQIQLSFINSLTEFGLVEITMVDGTQYIDIDQIKNIERIIRLHYDLEINLEGIDAINHLLQQVERLQEELKSIKRITS